MKKLVVSFELAITDEGVKEFEAKAENVDENNVEEGIEFLKEVFMSPASEVLTSSAEIIDVIVVAK